MDDRAWRGIDMLHELADIALEAGAINVARDRLDRAEQQLG